MCKREGRSEERNKGEERRGKVGKIEIKRHIEGLIDLYLLKNPVRFLVSTLQ